MKALLLLHKVRDVVEISTEDFKRGYIDIVYQEPLIAMINSPEGAVVDNSLIARRVRLTHHNFLEGNLPIFEEG